jgi:hypothetical protein
MLKKEPMESIRYVDRPDVTETFVDSFRLATYDGFVFKIELCATRMDEPNPNEKPTAARYPVCRLVMPPKTMLELYNQLHQFISQFEAQGLLKKTLVTPDDPKRTVN